MQIWWTGLYDHTPTLTFIIILPHFYFPQKDHLNIDAQFTLVKLLRMNICPWDLPCENAALGQKRTGISRIRAPKRSTGVWLQCVYLHLINFNPKGKKERREVRFLLMTFIPYLCCQISLQLKRKYNMVRRFGGTMWGKSSWL